jgi:hypothetical protein
VPTPIMDGEPVNFGSVTTAFSWCTPGTDPVDDPEHSDDYARAKWIGSDDAVGVNSVSIAKRPGRVTYDVGIARSDDGSSGYNSYQAYTDASEPSTVTVTGPDSDGWFTFAGKVTAFGDSVPRHLNRDCQPGPPRIEHESAVTLAIEMRSHVGFVDAEGTRHACLRRRAIGWRHRPLCSMVAVMHSAAVLTPPCGS